MQLLFSSNTHRCAEALVARLTAELRDQKRVLWFLTGGSNIAVDLAVMADLPSELTKNLAVTLTDERYGKYGHVDSNWQQLLAGGLDVKQAKAYPVLQENNPDLAVTTQLYNDNLNNLLASNDVVIGFYGMGTDGHIAGILPHSPAVKANGLATSYNTEQFTRLTTTFETIRHCGAVYMYAGGDSKHEALKNLQKELSFTDQPAQILKQLPEAYVFNDYIGDNQ